MIIVEIKGGLGNQFFTYAFAYALSKKHNSPMILDSRIYDIDYKLRKCQLSSFNIENNDFIMRKSFGSNKVGVLMYRAVRKWKLLCKYNPHKIQEVENFKLQNIEIKNNGNYYFSGYWQNYRYFDEVRGDLLRQFVIKENETNDIKKILKSIDMKKTIAIHVRRADYKTFKGGKCLSIDYYNDAIAKMVKIVGVKMNFLIFTDDVEFCKENLKLSHDTYYISDLANMSDIEEFYIMSQCYHFIIANSTFSWWAAYISENESKTVIAPVVDMWKEDFYPREWMTLTTNLERGI